MLRWALVLALVLLNTQRTSGDIREFLSNFRKTSPPAKKISDDPLIYSLELPDGQPDIARRNSRFQSFLASRRLKRHLASLENEDEEIQIPRSVRQKRCHAMDQLQMKHQAEVAAMEREAEAEGMSTVKSKVSPRAAPPINFTLTDTNPYKRAVQTVKDYNSLKHYFNLLDQQHKEAHKAQYKDSLDNVRSLHSSLYPNAHNSYTAPTGYWNYDHAKDEETTSNHIDDLSYGNNPKWHYSYGSDAPQYRSSATTTDPGDHQISQMLAKEFENPGFTPEEAANFYKLFGLTNEQETAVTPTGQANSPLGTPKPQGVPPLKELAGSQLAPATQTEPVEALITTISSQKPQSESNLPAEMLAKEFGYPGFTPEEAANFYKLFGVKNEQETEATPTGPATSAPNKQTSKPQTELLQGVSQPKETVGSKLVSATQVEPRQSQLRATDSQKQKVQQQPESSSPNISSITSKDNEADSQHQPIPQIQPNKRAPEKSSNQQKIVTEPEKVNTNSDLFEDVESSHLHQQQSQFSPQVTQVKQVSENPNYPQKEPIKERISDSDLAEELEPDGHFKQQSQRSPQSWQPNPQVQHATKLPATENPNNQRQTKPPEENISNDSDLRGPEYTRRRQKQTSQLQKIGKIPVAEKPNYQQKTRTEPSEENTSNDSDLRDGEYRRRNKQSSQQKMSKLLAAKKPNYRQMEHMGSPEEIIPDHSDIVENIETLPQFSSKSGSTITKYPKLSQKLIMPSKQLKELAFQHDQENQGMQDGGVNLLPEQRQNFKGVGVKSKPTQPIPYEPSFLTYDKAKSTGIYHPDHVKQLPTDTIPQPPQSSNTEQAARLSYEMPPRPSWQTKSGLEAANNHFAQQSSETYSKGSSAKTNGYQNPDSPEFKARQGVESISAPDDRRNPNLYEGVMPNPRGYGIPEGNVGLTPQTLASLPMNTHSELENNANTFGEPSSDPLAKTPASGHAGGEQGSALPIQDTLPKSQWTGPKENLKTYQSSTRETPRHFDYNRDGTVEPLHNGDGQESTYENQQHDLFNAEPAPIKGKGNQEENSFNAEEERKLLTEVKPQNLKDRAQLLKAQMEEKVKALNAKLDATNIDALGKLKKPFNKKVTETENKPITLSTPIYLPEYPEEPEEDQQVHAEENTTIPLGGTKLPQKIKAPQGRSSLLEKKGKLRLNQKDPMKLSDKIDRASVQIIHPSLTETEQFINTETQENGKEKELNRQPTPEVTREEAAPEVVKLQKMYLDTLPSHILGKEYGFYNTPDAVNLEKQKEPSYQVLVEEPKTTREQKIKTPIKSETQAERELRFEESKPGYPLKYLKDNIHADEPYSLVVEGQQKDFEDQEDDVDPNTPEYKIMKLIEEAAKRREENLKKLDYLFHPTPKNNEEPNDPTNMDGGRGLIVNPLYRKKSYAKNNAEEAENNEEEAPKKAAGAEFKIVNGDGKTINQPLNADKLEINSGSAQNIDKPNDAYHIFTAEPISTAAENDQQQFMTVLEPSEQDPFENDELAKSAEGSSSEEDRDSSTGEEYDIGDRNPGGYRIPPQKKKLGVPGVVLPEKRINKWSIKEQINESKNEKETKPKILPRIKGLERKERPTKPLSSMSKFKLPKIRLNSKAPEEETNPKFEVPNLAISNPERASAANDEPQNLQATAAFPPINPRLSDFNTEKGAFGNRQTQQTPDENFEAIKSPIENPQLFQPNSILGNELKEGKTNVENQQIPGKTTADYHIERPFNEASKLKSELLTTSNEAENKKGTTKVPKSFEYPNQTPTPNGEAFSVASKQQEPLNQYYAASQPVFDAASQHINVPSTAFDVAHKQQDPINRQHQPYDVASQPIDSLQAAFDAVSKPTASDYASKQPEFSKRQQYDSALDPLSPSTGLGTASKPLQPTNPPHNMADSSLQQSISQPSNRPSTAFDVASNQQSINRSQQEFNAASQPGFDAASQHINPPSTTLFDAGSKQFQPVNQDQKVTEASKQAQAIPPQPAIDVPSQPINPSSPVVGSKRVQSIPSQPAIGLASQPSNSPLTEISQRQPIKLSPTAIDMVSKQSQPANQSPTSLSGQSSHQSPADFGATLQPINLASSFDVTSQRAQPISQQTQNDFSTKQSELTHSSPAAVLPAKQPLTVDSVSKQSQSPYPQPTASDASRPIPQSPLDKTEYARIPEQQQPIQTGGHPQPESSQSFDADSILSRPLWGKGRTNQRNPQEWLKQTWNRKALQGEPSQSSVQPEQQTPAKENSALYPKPWEWGTLKISPAPENIQPDSSAYLPSGSGNERNPYQWSQQPWGQDVAAITPELSSRQSFDSASIQAPETNPELEGAVSNLERGNRGSSQQWPMQTWQQDKRLGNNPASISQTKPTSLGGIDDFKMKMEQARAQYKDYLTAARQSFKDRYQKKADISAKKPVNPNLPPKVNPAAGLQTQGSGAQFSSNVNDGSGQNVQQHGGGFLAQPEQVAPAPRQRGYPVEHPGQAGGFLPQSPTPPRQKFYPVPAEEAHPPGCGCGQKGLHAESLDSLKSSYQKSQPMADSDEIGRRKPPAHTCACGNPPLSSQRHSSCEDNVESSHSCACNSDKLGETGTSRFRHGDLLRSAAPNEPNKYDILHNMILWMKRYGNENEPK